MGLVLGLTIGTILVVYVMYCCGEGMCGKEPWPFNKREGGKE